MLRNSASHCHSLLTSLCIPLSLSLSLSLFPSLHSLHPACRCWFKLKVAMLRQLKLIHYSARAICVCFSCTPILRRSSSAYMDKEMDENLTFCFIYFIRIRGGEVPLRKSPFGRPFLCSGDQSVFEEGSVMYSWMICCFLFLWCSKLVFYVVPSIYFSYIFIVEFVFVLSLVYLLLSFMRF